MESCVVNLTNHRARVRWRSAQTQLSKLLIAVHQVGYQAKPLSTSNNVDHLDLQNRDYLRRIGVAGVGMMQVMMYAIALYAGAFEDMAAQHRDLLRWASFAISTPVALYAALPFHRSAWRSLSNRRLNMDVPVSIAILLAYIASAYSTVTQGQEVYFDSVCMFTFFLLIGRFLELRARLKIGETHQSSRPVLPQTVNRLAGERLETIALKDIQVGDHILVKSGDTVPADGLLLDQAASFDESLITGEFLPVVKQQDETVIAGSINREQPARIKVERIGQETRLAAILRLLDFAEASKPPIAMLADRIARYFVLFVLATASAVALFWHFQDSNHTLWITLSVLVVTCPCALSLATPTALTAATSRLAQAGLVIVKGHTLEGLTQATHVLFDKTGTLTKGSLTLADIKPVTELSRTECLGIAAALEAHSEHPIARAFEETPVTASSVNIHPGAGVEGYVRGELYRIGRPDFVRDISATGKAGLTLPDGFDQGQWFLLGSRSGPVAWFKLDDEIRADGEEAIQRLFALGLEVSIISGDQSSNVANVARALSIKDYHAAMSPAEKLAHIQKLQANGARVVVVGDGINDVPVLASADISIAMTDASDLAKAQADAVLLSGRLSGVTNAISLSRRCRSIIRQNIGWALAYNAGALPLAAMGFVPPYAAAIGMSASSLIVVFNALRLNGPRRNRR